MFFQCVNMAFLVWIILLGSLGQLATAGADDAARVLARECYSCHNQVKSAGALSLHTHETLMRGGKKGPVLIPGRSEDSRMIQMVEGLLEPIMPEDGFLAEEDVEILRYWINAGAPAWEGDLGRIRLETIPDIQLTVAVKPEIASLVFHPDGNLLAAGSYREIRLISPADREVMTRLSGLAETVRSLAFSSDGSLLASGAGMPSRFGEISIWDLVSRQLKSRWEGHTDCIYSIAFHPDGKVLATSSYDRLIKLWDVKTGKELRSISGHVDAVYAIAFDPSGTRLVSASADRTVKVWEVASGTQMGTPLSGSTAELYTVAVHPTGRWVAAAGVDRMIRIWKLEKMGGVLVQSVFSHDSPVVDLSFTSDGETLVSVGSSGGVKIWDAFSLKEHVAIEPQQEHVLALALSPSGETLALGRYDGVVVFDQIK